MGRLTESVVCQVHFCGLKREHDGKLGKDGETMYNDPFILRIWWEESQKEWRIWVQHVHSGKSALVRDSKDLWAFIEHMVKKPKKRPSRGLK